MHPFERLRYVARAGPVAAALVAVEAAQALAALADEPGALLTAARRLLGFHPLCGPLWWVCAQVLAADDPGLAAAFASAELSEDPTPRQLRRSLRRLGAPLVVAAVEDGERLAEAAAGGPASSIRIVAEGRMLGRSMEGLRYSAGDVSGWLPDELPAALDGCQVALVEILAGGPDGLVAPVGAAALARSAGAAGIPVWGIGGTGRILPAALFDVVLARLDELGAPRTAVGSAGFDEVAGAVGGELVDADLLELVIGQAGAQAASRALSTSDCPVPPELLRRAR